MGDETSGWRAFGERAIYDSPEVWLGQVDVELPDGERVWHHVVRSSRVAVMVLLDELPGSKSWPMPVTWGDR